MAEFSSSSSQWSGPKVAANFGNYDGPMAADVTRDELNAKLETIEARMDARVASIEGKIDVMLARLEGDRARTDLQYQHIESSAAATQESVRGMKTNVIVTAIAAVIAIVGGIAAFNSTLLSNMVSSFESGKSTATAINQATEQLKQTQEQLKAIEARLSAPPASPQVPASR